MRRCYVLVVCMFVLGGCADQPPPRIGIVVSTTPARAAQMAAAGLQPGEPGYFEAVIADPGNPPTDAAHAIDQASGFAEDPRVLAVVGHANSASSLAGSQIYNSAGLVQIAPTTTAPVYSEAGPFSFRLVPNDTLQAAYLEMVLRHHWPDSRVALIHVNDDYGRGLVRVVRQHLGNVVYEGPYADGADSTDVARLRDGIVQSGADVLVWLGRPGTLGMLLSSLRSAKPGIGVVCADACDVAAVYGNSDGRFDGLFFVRFFDPLAPDSALREFQTRYRTQTGEVASSEALLTYDAVMLLGQALRDGARTREDVRRYLVSLGRDRPEFKGLTGSIRFDDTGAFVRRYMLAEVRPDGVSAAAHAVHEYAK